MNDLWRGFNFFLPNGYQINPEPRYEHDIQEGGVVYQPFVYSDVVRRIREEGGRPIVIDVGCGRAQKLLALEGVKTLGIDFGPNVEFLRRTYPTQHWEAQDLETGVCLPKDLLRGSSVICADVVEHLKDPTRLLESLARWESEVREIVISTPDRDLHYGRPHLGPPRNRCHVREWCVKEFTDLLHHFGLHPRLSLTQSSTKGPELHTIQAICSIREG